MLAQLAADEAEILSIGVAKEWQRKGLGVRLMEGADAGCKRAEAKRLFSHCRGRRRGVLGGFIIAWASSERGSGAAYYTRPDGSTADALTLAITL